MVPFGEPQIVMFGSGNKKGYTLVQLIETSNITAHFVEETDDLYLDVFSCKEFLEEDVVQMIDYHFKPMNYETTFLKRRAPHPENTNLC
jgi:S-adenosylmethionine/arginine decarboxylase-like enzyme